MNKSYETMRDFWLDVKNLQHKKEVPQLGEQKICIAGVEMAARDTKGGIKNLMIAASSLGNASVYFENNSASGLGGFTGGAASGPVREKSLRLMQTAATEVIGLEPVEVLPTQSNPQHVTLFAVSGEGQLYAKDVAEQEVRNPAHALYAFFAYTQQVLAAFRQEQSAVQEKAPSAEPKDKK